MVGCPAASGDLNLRRRFPEINSNPNGEGTTLNRTFHLLGKADILTRYRQMKDLSPPIERRAARGFYGSRPDAVQKSSAFIEVSPASLQQSINSYTGIIGDNHASFGNDRGSKSNTSTQTVPACVHIAVPQFFGNFRSIIGVEYARSSSALLIGPHDSVLGSVR